VADQIQLRPAPATSGPLLVFDELHKYSKWTRFLKGFYDTYADAARIVVTGRPDWMSSSAAETASWAATSPRMHL